MSRIVSIIPLLKDTCSSRPHLMSDSHPRRFSKKLDSLDRLLDECWNQLEEAARSAKHGWHLPVLGSIEGERARTRMVVLRGVDVDSRTIWCHTDRRSTKISDVEKQPAVSWLFYDSEDRVQLSVHARAMVHTRDAIAESAWESSRVESLRCYLAPDSPGELSSEPTVNLPAELIERPPSAEEAAAGRDNFAVIQTEVESLELLYLQQSGNVRARFWWAGDAWAKSWVTP